MAELAERHYDDKYFAWQSEHGDLGGKANAFKFSAHVKPTDKIVDFGCGGGYLLDNLNAADRIGVDINQHALASARARGINVCSSTSEISDAWADVVVSNHAIEHVIDPYATMKEFHRVLKSGGTLVVVTPYDSTSTAFSKDDRDFHLFGWSPSNLGNLAKATGFEVICAREMKHRWPPGWATIVKVFGWHTFNFLSWVYALCNRKRTQIRLVARRP